MDQDANDAQPDAQPGVPPRDPPGEAWSALIRDPAIPEMPEILRERPPAARESTAPPIAGIARGWGLAIDFIASILLMLLLGWVVDGWQGTSPAFTLAGLGVGFAIALTRIIRATLREERREAAKRGKIQPPK